MPGDAVPGTGRRSAVLAALAIMAGGSLARPLFAQVLPTDGPVPDRRWYEAAQAMLRLAQSWGDQPYGAVLVMDGRIVGEGPSRVLLRGDAAAHAEREAIRDAQRRLGRDSLAGSVLYSTSRPCRQCEAAAAQAQVARMFHGPALADAGMPQP
jgi:tRNA(Arg) A34 adenosine deaminase TadA